MQKSVNVGCAECAEKQVRLKKMSEGFNEKHHELETTQGQLRRTQEDLGNMQVFSGLTERELKTVKGELASVREDLEEKKGLVKIRDQKLETMQEEMTAAQGQIFANYQQIIATQSHLVATEAQLLITQNGLQATQVELAATKTTLAEYRQFANVVRPAMALAGAAACAYAVYNNPAMLAEAVSLGVSLLNRNVGTAMAIESLSQMVKGYGYGLETATAVAGLVGYATSSLVGPAAAYGVLKLASAIANLPVNIIKTVYGYREALLTLAVLGALAYYNPYASVMLQAGLTELSTLSGMGMIAVC